MNARKQRIEALFEGAIDLDSPDQREVYLNKLCGDDANLQVEVMGLIRAYEKAGKFLTEGSAQKKEGEQSTADDLPAEIASPLSEDIGSSIGPYKLLQKLGEGGFGVVYMADQKKPVKRRVALKIIKLGMDTKQVVGRFEGERQALAMMDHPNIAKVFDAGATDSGRPFFVMELVKGIPVTKYCDENNLTTQERLELFVPICKAIQHAHQKGVIHRDIKPNNIMITLHDGVPVPKVIDFGIAKATQQELTEHTVFTQYGQFIGTPAYMSPEQAEMSGLDIDTRSDIYSLGVLLYELITGRTPLDTKELMSGGYDEIRRRIREVEPAKPSTRVSTLIDRELTTLARQRNTNPRKLSHHLRGDLDWIVMKALEKDRTRRYDTPNELIADLNRFLNDEPVSAAAPSLVYQIQKLARRYKTAFTVAASITAAVLIGSTVAILQAVRATKAEHQTQRELYYANIQLADRHIEEGNIDLALKVLTECPLQYRHWEWGRLLYLCYQDVWSTKVDGTTALSFPSLIYFSPGSDQLGTIGADGQLHVWRTMDGKELWAYGGHSNQVHSFRFAPNGTELALINGKGAIELWDTQDWIQRIQIAPVDDGKFSQVHFSRDRIAAVDGSSRVALFETDSGRRLASFEGRPTAEFNNLLISQDATLIGANGRQHVSYWQIGSLGQIVSDYHMQRTESSTLKRLGHKYTAWQTAESEFEIRRVGNGEKVAALNVQGRLRDIFFSPDNGLLCAIGGSGMARVWNLPSGKEQCAFHARFYNGTFSSDGKRIVTFGQGRVVQIWDAVSGRELRAHKGHGDIARAAIFSPDDKWVAIGSGGPSGGLKLWRSDHGRERLKNTSWVWGAALSPDGKRMAIAGDNWIASVRDIESGAELHTLRGHFNSLFGIDFSPDGDRIATASRDETARIWNANTGEELHTLRGHTQEVRTLAFSPDGQRIATGSFDGLTKIWDATNGQELLNLKGHTYLVVSLAWHPTKERIATSGFDGTARIWDTTHGAEILNLEGHSGRINAIAFSLDGTLIVTGGDDRTIRLWDSESGKEMSSMSSKGPIVSVAFSPDGKRLVTIYSEQAEHFGSPSIEIWELESGRELLRMKSHGDMLWTARWRQSGDRIISASFDTPVGVTEVWESFPYRLEDYPGQPNAPLLERAQLYATEYWRQRITAENLTTDHTRPTTDSTTAKIPRNWFPTRDPNSGPEQLDLTEFYNALLNVSWHPSNRGFVMLGFDLEELPTGLVTLSNHVFDVRGVVQLADNQKDWQDLFETRVSGIKVGQKLKRLQFLHGANIDSLFRMRPSLSGQAASYVMHYADGTQVEFPILYGRDVLTLAWNPSWANEKAEGANIVWRGLNSAIDHTGYGMGSLKEENKLRLFKSVWENPRPDEEIVSIDYVSTETKYLLPFLIAITTEP